jgi:hypothetical protein
MAPELSLTRPEIEPLEIAFWLRAAGENTQARENTTKLTMIVLISIASGSDLSREPYPVHLPALITPPL